MSSNTSKRITEYQAERREYWMAQTANAMRDELRGRGFSKVGGKALSKAPKVALAGALVISDTASKAKADDDAKATTPAAQAKFDADSAKLGAKKVVVVNKTGSKKPPKPSPEVLARAAAKAKSRDEAAAKAKAERKAKRGNGRRRPANWPESYTRPDGVVVNIPASPYALSDDDFWTLHEQVTGRRLTPKMRGGSMRRMRAVFAGELAFGEVPTRKGTGDVLVRASALTDELLGKLQAMADSTSCSRSDVARSLFIAALERAELSK